MISENETLINVWVRCIRSKCDECCAAVILSFTMSMRAVDTVPSLSEHLHFLHSCSSDELVWLVSVLNLAERLPQAFLDGLAEEDRTTCYHVTLLCYCVTLSVQIPCEMQLRVVLAKQHKKDSLVSAGTGSSKTLPTILNALLDTPDQWLSVKKKVNQKSVYSQCIVTWLSPTFGCLFWLLRSGFSQRKVSTQSMYSHLTFGRFFWLLWSGFSQQKVNEKSARSHWLFID